ncbi:hypothetical protein ABE493_08650 [Stenotrophomonas terrae]|uniref:hypothetical protein n=1 Tax=Stenotrophomonas terrae TaxID=405446 RepID=UPI00320AA665
MSTEHEDLERIHNHVYAAVDAGQLSDATRAFDVLLQHHPDNPFYHYMRGLALKYQMDWAGSLRDNLRAIELSEEFGQAQHWNAAIAATGLGQWATVRELWAACGIAIPEGDGPIDGDFGVAVVRLNPWSTGETVFMRRIDPVRARILNVPLPESGHRFGDIVLHDGAATGARFDGEREVHVFNELERVVPSDFQTFVVFVRAESREDLDALLRASAPGIGYAEDWSHSIRHYCLRCSYGAPHTHAQPADQDQAQPWQPERNLGIAAQSHLSVEKLLKDWVAGHPGRQLDAIETRECATPVREDGHAWWLSPDEADEDEAAPSDEDE